MDANKAFWPQSIAESVKGIVRRNLMADYTNSFTIYFDLAQLFAKFSVMLDTLLNLENARKHQRACVTEWASGVVLRNNLLDGGLVDMAKVSQEFRFLGSSYVIIGL